MNQITKQVAHKKPPKGAFVFLGLTVYYEHTQMDSKTIDTYNKRAREYDNETSDFWQVIPRTIVDRFVSSIPAKGTVLDVGSGPGRDGLILQGKGLEVVCLDASVKMVEMC